MIGLHRLIILSVAVFVAGCDTREAQNAEPPPAPVAVLTLVPRDVQLTREWLGRLDGSVNVDVRARVSGYLTQVNVEEGAIVEQGTLLFEVDPRPLRAALLEAQSTLKEREAAALRNATEEARQKRLLDNKAVSQSDYDTALQAKLASEAAVEAAKAQVEQAQLNLDYSRILAPVTGIVGRTAYSVGDVVGQKNLGEALVKMSVVDPIKAVFALTEIEYLAFAERIAEALALPLVQRRDSAELVLADGRVHSHKGRFQSADRQVDSQTGTFTLATVFPNPKNILRPGQFARVRAEARLLKDALVVPQRAVQSLQGLYQAAVVGEGDIAEVRTVKLGQRIGSDWVVEEGLAGGERLIVEGWERIRSGSRVRVSQWEQDGAAPGDEAESSEDGGERTSE